MVRVLGGETGWPARCRHP